MTVKTYRCYVVYTITEGYDQVSSRQGEVIWVNAVDPDSARNYMLRVISPKEIKDGEEVDRIVASAWAEDKALRRQGAQELPLDFD